MITTILFDLDGTLLPMDLDEFLRSYFHHIGSYFHDLIDTKEFMNYLGIATEAMMNHSGETTNETVFMDTFFNLIKGDPRLYLKRFDSFYANVFPKIQSSVGFSPVINDSVRLLKEKGYELVVATNPLFPRPAIEHRIAWAGFQPNDFIHITSYEYCHFSKPQKEYFLEILRNIQRKPEECLMVGNDVQDDLVAGDIDIKTFLITDHMIHRSEEDIPADYQGSYEDFHAFVENLPWL
ncbi:MAG: HAD family hydrolase [Epulopiscium sp.]|nr:HAD family hydrolase [Candidatus Epulonipiscium sp.]